MMKFTKLKLIFVSWNFIIWKALPSNGMRYEKTDNNVALL